MSLFLCSQQRGERGHISGGIGEEEEDVAVEIGVFHPRREEAFPRKLKIQRVTRPPDIGHFDDKARHEKNVDMAASVTRIYH